MKINWKSVAELGNKFLKVLVPGVAQIEVIAELLIKHGKTMTGAEKSAAVKALVKSSLETAEFASDRDLLDNAEVDIAAQAVIDSIVSFHKIVASVKAKRSGATGGA